MRKVLIVDDEEFIREGLGYVIDWETYGYEIIATAENGEIGLQKIRELKPDLVIADIQMPGKTGLEMIQFAVEEGVKFQAIILSGYSDFQYAKQAIHLGAVSYLLKPIDEDELIEILLELQRKQEVDQSSQMKRQLLDKLFGSDTTGFPFGPYINLVRSEKKFDCHSIRLAVDLDGIKSIPFIQQGKQYVAFLSREPLNNTQWKANLATLLPETEVLVSGWFDGRVTVRPLLEEIQKLEKFIFLLPNQLISNDTIESLKTNAQQTVEEKERLLEALLSAGAIDCILESYFHQFYHQSASKEQINWQLENDYQWIITQIQERVLVKVGSEFGAIHEQLYQVNNFLDAKFLISRVYSELALSLERELNTFTLIDEIIQYTANHYRDDLSLKSIGEVFNYNSAYLGKKFRRETGKNFLNFLEEIRMEKASEILRNSNLMVYEVANAVGYTNVDYFYKKFKHYYHVSPNTLRRK